MPLPWNFLKSGPSAASASVAVALSRTPVAAAPTPSWAMRWSSSRLPRLFS